MNSFINDFQERSDKAEVWSKAVAYIRTHESRVRILTLINMKIIMFCKLRLQRSPTSQYFSWADDECWCCSGSRGCAAHLWRGVPGLAMASWSRMVCVSWYSSFKSSVYLRSPGSQPPSPRSPVRPTSMGSPQTPVSPPNQVSRVTAR